MSLCPEEASAAKALFQLPGRLAGSRPYLPATDYCNTINSGAGALVGSSSHAIGVWAVGFIAIAVGASLFVGSLTPVASTAAASGYLMTGVSSFSMTQTNNHISTLTAFNLAAISAALVLLGPGAFSLDARLFGRREIIIP
jgi:uncharacterized membrane protein YphA (DoxX/SURF4 family)